MKKINELWQNLTIKNKTTALTTLAFLSVAVLLLFDLWVVKFLTVDLNRIMEDNARVGELTDAFSAEKELFSRYVREQTEENKKQLETQIATTGTCVFRIPSDYGRLGDERYAQLQSIRSSYGLYRVARDRVLKGEERAEEHIQNLYKIYEMQDYLISYARRFSSAAQEAGNAEYRRLLPLFYGVPAVAILTCILLFLMVIWVTRTLNHGIVAPILNLTKAARKIAANDFYIDDVKTDRKDELGELVKVFNKMKYATGEYIGALEEKREVLEQLHVREVENLEVEKQLEIMNLELLRSQINPHFLFNTLNVIEGMANLEDAETTEKMIGALSSIFRYNLKNQDTEVLLSRELKVARDYMYLQKMRFGDRVEFEVQCDVKAEEVLIPTFTLQPLLENAVVHGLSPKIEGGVIRAVFREDDGRLCVEICDSGVGMSDAVLQEIRENLKTGNYDQVGIGIGNIYRRIKTMYENAGMEAESREGEGTVVRLYVPLRRLSDRPAGDIEKGSDAS